MAQVWLPSRCGQPETWTQTEKDLNTTMQDPRKQFLRDFSPDMEEYKTAIASAVDMYYCCADRQCVGKDGLMQQMRYVLAIGSFEQSIRRLKLSRLPSNRLQSPNQPTLSGGFLYDMSSGHEGQNRDSDDDSIVDRKRRRIYSRENKYNAERTNLSQSELQRTQDKQRQISRSQGDKRPANEDNVTHSDKEQDGEERPNHATDREIVRARRHVADLRNIISEDNTALLQAKQPKCVTNAAAR